MVQYVTHLLQQLGFVLGLAAGAVVGIGHPGLPSGLRHWDRFVMRTVSCVARPPCAGQRGVGARDHRSLRPDRNS